MGIRKLKQPKPAKVQATVTIKVTVDPTWIDTVTRDVDLFSTNYCGYWMRRLDTIADKRKGSCKRLAWEFDGEGQAERLKAFVAREGLEEQAKYIADLTNKEETLFHVEAMEAFRKGEPLPPCYFLLDEELAVRAWCAMVALPGRLGGVDWYERSDADSYDVAMQMALLGEVRYS